MSNIIDVNDLIGYKAYWGSIGRQNNMHPDGWENYNFPKLIEVKIKNISCNGCMVNQTNDRLMTDFYLSLECDSIELSFRIVKSELEGGIIVNYIDIGEHHLFGLDEESVRECFVRDVKKILTSSWGGINNIKACQALRRYILEHDVEYFEENHPDLLI